MIGFGSYHYKYESGYMKERHLYLDFHQGRVPSHLHIALDEVNREKYLSKFGASKSSKGCIYVNKLSDIDEEVLRK
ncbi:MAG: DUF1801 domain-containing protein [Saprospiraceae bacterium]|nr:DUF1801 domain-containing protein [Candidatus Brachybacter algidus]